MGERKREEPQEDGALVIKAGVEDANLAANVREGRQRAGMSQGELARRMKAAGWPWHQQTTRRVEEGSRQVGAGEAAALARILGTTVTRLLMPGRKASLAYLLDMAAGRAREAHEQVASWTASLEAARRQLSVTIAEALESPYAESPEIAGLIREAQAAAGLDPRDAVAEGIADGDDEDDEDGGDSR
jgi:transcriptional regulator with XRE-family HTH domain